MNLTPYDKSAAEAGMEAMRSNKQKGRLVFICSNALIRGATADNDK